jgi:hypothetical protein
MNTDISKTFEEEFLSFFALYVMNLVIGALAIAFGVQYMFTSMLGLTAGLAPPELRIIAGAVAMVCFGLGIAWIMVTAKLSKSVKVVRDAYKQKKKREMTSDDFTCMLIHLMTQYREQKKTVRAMVFICQLGGMCFIIMALSGIPGIIAGLAAGDAIFTNILAVVAVVVMVIMGGGSLLISAYFQRYAKVWDSRLAAIATSEGELDRMLERA